MRLIKVRVGQPWRSSCELDVPNSNRIPEPTFLSALYKTGAFTCVVRPQNTQKKNKETFDEKHSIYAKYVASRRLKFCKNFLKKVDEGLSDDYPIGKENRIGIDLDWRIYPTLNRIRKGVALVETKKGRISDGTKEIRRILSATVEKYRRYT